MTLDEIGMLHQTDKASHHRYLSFYDLIFRRLRDCNIRILEVGIQFGNSLRTWRDYFPEAKIIGIDSVDNNVSCDAVMLLGNAYSEDMIARLGDQKFDIMIDDGSHAPDDQLWFVKHYLPLLADGGILIVEDVLHAATIYSLASALPKGFSYTAVEMTEGRSMVDSRLFIAWKN